MTALIRPAVLVIFVGLLSLGVLALRLAYSPNDDPESRLSQEVQRLRDATSCREEARQEAVREYLARAHHVGGNHPAVSGMGPRMARLQQHCPASGRRESDVGIRRGAALRGDHSLRQLPDSEETAAGIAAGSPASGEGFPATASRQTDALDHNDGAHREESLTETAGEFALSSTHRPSIARRPACARKAMLLPCERRPTPI